MWRTRGLFYCGREVVQESGVRCTGAAVAGRCRYRRKSDANDEQRDHWARHMILGDGHVMHDARLHCSGGASRAISRTAAVTACAHASISAASAERRASVWPLDSMTSRCARCSRASTTRTDAEALSLRAARGGRGEGAPLYAGGAGGARLPELSAWPARVRNDREP
eukprot:5894997-Prymnesium_polylepis.1